MAKADLTRQSVFQGRQVLILSSVDWDAVWQRHHALAESMAKAGAEVFFVENTGFRDLKWSDAGRVLGRLARILSHAPRRRGRRIVAPLTLPPTRPLFRALNAVYFVPLLLRRLRRQRLRPHPLVFAYLPTATTLQILDSVEPGLVVYDSVDNFYGHPSPPADMKETESELLRRSSLVLATSRFLYEAAKAKHPNVLNIHHGVSPGFFLSPEEMPSAYRRLCYFGTVWSAVDFAPLKALAESGFEVTLIGPVKEKLPPLPPSIRFLPAVAHSDLPRALASYDVLLLPYAQTPYNLGVVPAKTYECLATGKPVLASALPSLEGFEDVLYFARKPEDFVRVVRSLPQTETLKKASARIEAAREHSTIAQFRKIEAAIHEASLPPHAPRPAGEKSWRAPSWMEAVLRGFSWIAFFFAAARALVLLTQFLAAHFLGPEQYGKAHLLIAVASISQILPMLGFPLALARHGAAQETEAGRQRVVSTALTVFMLWAAVCGAVFWPISTWLAERFGLGGEGWTLALGFATAVYQVTASSLQGLGKFKHRGEVEAIYGIVSAAALCLLLLSGRRNFQMLIFSFIAGLSAATACGVWLLRSYIRLHMDRKALSDILLFAFLGTISVLAMAFTQAPGRIITFHFRSASEAGIYSIYFMATAQIALALVFMASTVLIPLTSRSKSQQEAWAFLHTFSPKALFALVAFFIACACAALFPLRDSYPLRLDLILLFSASGTVILLHGTVSAVYAARDLNGLLVSVSGALAAGLGNLIFNAFLTPRWGLSGAAASLLCGYLLGLGWYLFHQPRSAD
ncbi:MAG: oligosaccharide flippase family protein [Elusimicrobia bacterium]|nr:oligosaccharide flippase family protein [Elusimicrobiota bacterium]